jgi:formate dehydrogenase subunit delta
VTGHGASDAKLVSMANQIAAFFRAYPEAEARDGIVQHIADFWTPAMRRNLQAAIEHGEPGLDGMVVRALGNARGDKS